MTFLLLYRNLSSPHPQFKQGSIMAETGQEGGTNCSSLGSQRLFLRM